MPSDEADTSAGETPDRSIVHGSYRIKRAGAQIHLNDNESPFEDDVTELSINSTTDEIGSPPGILVQATFKDGGFLEAYTGLTLTPDQAVDVAERLLRAAEEYRAGNDYWEQ